MAPMLVLNIHSDAAQPSRWDRHRDTISMEGRTENLSVFQDHFDDVLIRMDLRGDHRVTVEVKYIHIKPSLPAKPSIHWRPSKISEVSDSQYRLLRVGRETNVIQSPTLKLPENLIA